MTKTGTQSQFLTYLESRVKKISFKKKKELENSLIKEFNISRELKDTNMGFAIEKKKREREREKRKAA